MSANTACDRVPVHGGERAPGAAAITVRIERAELPVAGIGTLPLCFSLVGPAGAPVVAALGGISATYAVCDDGGEAGWWSDFAGPGRALDTDSVRVLGWTYPTPPGRTLSTAQHAQALVALLDHLGIATMQALVGASYGGMVGLALAHAHPQRLATLVAISAAHGAHPLATGWRAIQRRIVRLGLEHGAAHDALVLARALAMTTYRSPEELKERFAGAPSEGPHGPVFPVERYLLSRGEDYARRTAPAHFLALSEALDLHAVTPEEISVPAHFVAVRQDLLVPLAQMRELAARYGGPCRLHEIDSLYGHDAFLKEVELLGPILSSVSGSAHHV
jgi:homoserine O-acetyltransferase/O-succinyltransferase